MRRYLEERPDVPVHEKFAKALGLHDGWQVTAGSASRDHGLGPHRLGHMIRAFPDVVERTVSGSGGRIRTILSRERLSDLLAEASAVVTAGWLLREAGIGHRTCHDLVKAGLLVPVERDVGRLTSARARRDVDCFYRRSDVEALLARLTSALPPGRPSRQFLALGTLMSLAGKRGMTRPDLYRCIGTGALLPRALDEKRRGPAALLFDSAEVAVFFEHAAPRRFDDLLTLAEAAREAGWHPAVLRAMLAHGLVAARRGGRARRAPVLFTKDEVKRARTEYATVGDIARRHGTSHSAVLHRLRKAGVESALPSSAAGPGRSLFRAEDLARVNLAAIMPGASLRAAAGPALPAGDLTDEEWAALAPLLRPVAGLKDPIHGGREAFDGIAHVLRTGCGWWAVPPKYGSPRRAYQRLRLLAVGGIWDRALASVTASAGPPSLGRRLAAIVEHASAHFGKADPRPSPPCSLEGARLRGGGAAGG